MSTLEKTHNVGLSIIYYLASFLPRTLLIILPAFFVACSQVETWQYTPDNIVEETIEKSIKDYTSYEIDLTPVNGPERQKITIE